MDKTNKQKHKKAYNQMAIKKINSDENAVASEADLATMQEQAETSVVLARASSQELGSVSGDDSDVQIRPPYLKIGHGQGKLQDIQKGSLVIGEDDVIAKPGETILITILTEQYYWKEYISGTEYNPDVLPKIFATKAEVIEAGGTTDWSGTPGHRIAPTYKQAVALKVLVQKPDGVVSGLFGIPIGDKEYAVAMWNADKTAFGSIAPVIKTAKNFALRTRGLFSGIFSLKTQSQKFDSGFSAYIPKLVLCGHHSDEAVEEIKAFFPANNDVTVNDETEA